MKNPVVRVGQRWRDTDPRNKKDARVLTIERIDRVRGVAHCTARVGERTRATRVKLRRFRPGSTGYELLP